MKKVFLSIMLIALTSFSAGFAATYQQVSIQPIANWNLTTFCQSPPTGNVILGNVPFTIAQSGFNVFFSQDLGMGIGNPTQGTLTVNAEHVVKAHILIAGTDVRESFRNLQMGSIIFSYDDSSSVVYDLIVGDTIRDWITVPERVITTDSPNITPPHGVALVSLPGAIVQQSSTVYL